MTRSPEAMQAELREERALVEGPLKLIVLLTSTQRGGPCLERTIHGATLRTRKPGTFWFSSSRALV